MKAKTLQALHVVAKIVQERVHWSQPWKRLVELLVAALRDRDAGRTFHHSTRSTRRPAPADRIAGCLRNFCGSCSSCTRCSTWAQLGPPEQGAAKSQSSGTGKHEGWGRLVGIVPDKDLGVVFAGCEHATIAALHIEERAVKGEARGIGIAGLSPKACGEIAVEVGVLAAAPGLKVLPLLGVKIQIVEAALVLLQIAAVVWKRLGADWRSVHRPARHRELVPVAGGRILAHECLWAQVEKFTWRRHIVDQALPHVNPIDVGNAIDGVSGREASKVREGRIPVAQVHDHPAGGAQNAGREESAGDQGGRAESAIPVAALAALEGEVVSSDRQPNATAVVRREDKKRSLPHPSLGLESSDHRSDDVRVQVVDHRKQLDALLERAHPAAPSTCCLAGHRPSAVRHAGLNSHIFSARLLKWSSPICSGVCGRWEVYRRKSGVDASCSSITRRARSMKNSSSYRGRSATAQYAGDKLSYRSIANSASQGSAAQMGFGGPAPAAGVE
eukprot:6176234-Pleurochrysis_carterae.AAC.2